MADHPKQRLLIFVVAYYAESTLRWVLERIPRGLFGHFDCEVLVVDDGSADRTFAIGREYKELHPEIRMTVLRNEYNQGYGGNARKKSAGRAAKQRVKSDRPKIDEGVRRFRTREKPA